MDPNDQLKIVHDFLTSAEGEKRVTALVDAAQILDNGDIIVGDRMCQKVSNSEYRDLSADGTPSGSSHSGNFDYGPEQLEKMKRSLAWMIVARQCVEENNLPALENSFQ